MRQALVAVLAALAGGIAGALLAISCVRQADDPAEAYLAANRAEVERMVLADVEKYGVDVYRLYLEITQAMSGAPGADFAADKAVKKLHVTYPESNIRRFADAHIAYGAIRKRDMMQIERYLEEVEKPGAARRFMPNGYDVVPLLVMAQYNYLFHFGRFADAERTLAHLEAGFGGDYIFQPLGKPMAVRDFVAAQRRVLEIVLRKEAK